MKKLITYLGHGVTRSVSLAAFLYPFSELTNYMGAPLLKSYSVTRFVYWKVLFPIIKYTEGHPYTTTALFFLMFFCIVRSEKMPQFVRYNVCQALLTYMLVAMFIYTFNSLPAGLRYCAFGVLLKNTIYLGVGGMILYCYSFIIRGKCAHIPFITPAVQLQIRRL